MTVQPFKLGVLLAVPVLFALAAHGEDGNRQWCEEWCTQHKPQCDLCSDKSGCGPAGEAMVEFKSRHGGKHWYACNAWRSAQNKEACESWCREHSGTDFGCVMCADNAGCGRGYRSVMSFTGRGDNWHACSKTAYRSGSESNRAECDAWCRANSECTKCSDNVGCGRGYKSIKTFGGRGENWYGCRKR